MKRYFLNLLLLILAGWQTASAAAIKGIVNNEDGKPLPFASILVKGSTHGTTTNSEGNFQIELATGSYTLVVQYVGYVRKEVKVAVPQQSEHLQIQMEPVQTTMKEVVVKSGGEDPAYAIIRNAIQKKKDYRAPLDSFSCEMYSKSFFKIRSFPLVMMGDTMTVKDRTELGLDSNGKSILYLSESFSRLQYRKPDQLKTDVIAVRESGRNGYGIQFHSFINFYNDHVQVLQLVSPRGFVSPIADGALNFYKYKYLGSFWEEGNEICRIQVIPKRNFEPVFSGIINIMDGSWRIHSLDLTVNRKAQLQLLDTVQIRQIHMPVQGAAWQIKDQTILFSFKLLGVDMGGMVLNAYNSYNTTPEFAKKTFGKVVLSYDTAVHSRPRTFWDTMRPIQLEADEVQDYHVKDSIYNERQSPEWQKHLRDSIRRSERAVNYKNMCTGIRLRNTDTTDAKELFIQFLDENSGYNTVEGTVLGSHITLSKRWDKQNRYLSFSPHTRYGFSNEHFNTWGTLRYTTGEKTLNAEGSSNAQNEFILSGGKRVSQFNKSNAVAPLLNTIHIFMYHETYLKLYENYFSEFKYIKRWDEDIKLTGSLLYEDRIPLENTTNASWYKKNRTFSPNYPTELLSQQFTRHQAVMASVEVQFQPGQKYIQYPHRRISAGSTAPVFAITYQKGIRNLLGSDADFDKWSIAAWNNMNLHLWGTFKYKIGMGGFLNNKQVAVQDYQHFNGNQFIIASQYVNSFQLAPYYANSTTAPFYAIAHIEHHFNGMLTNKIPLFKRLNWTLVAGTNTFYVNRDNNYVEVFAGLENIFKCLRVDINTSYLNGKTAVTALRLGLGGIFSPNMWRK